VGQGHLYQGRFKSFPVQDDGHLLKVLRYVERNPVRAGAVKRAEDWRWGSCHVRLMRTHELKPLLAEWPIERPARWTRMVNEPQTQAEEEEMKLHIARGRPLGEPAWVKRIAKRLNLRQTLRSRGRQMGWRAKGG
jgi:putative transposase